MYSQGVFQSIILFLRPNEITEGIPYVTRPIYGMGEGSEVSRREQREIVDTLLFSSFVPAEERVITSLDDNFAPQNEQR